MKQRMACLLIGILMGAVLLGGNVSQAAEAFLKAFPSTHTFYLDGQPIEMEAYSINGNNYVKLRDIGRMVGHHGQRDGASRELIAAIRPKVVVCCASSDRRYQSADPELLQMIAASGARLCFSDCPPVPREIPAPPPHRAVQIVLTGGRAPEITYFTKEGDVCHGGI